MKKISPTLLLFILFVLASCNKKERLFLENSNKWITMGDATWSFDKEVLEATISEGTGFVMTKQPYEDFELVLEFYPDSTINSGVFVRCKAFEIDAVGCHEMNIWDLHPNQDFRTGAIVTKAKPIARVHTLNQWNTYRIVQQGNLTQVWINDTLTAKHKDTTLTKGYVGLQAAGKGKIKFRNIILEDSE